MSKDAVTDWSTTASDNTDVGGIDLGEGTMQVSAVNGAFREIMAQIAQAIDDGEFTTIPFNVASSAAAASLEFHEATDNGTNKVTLIGPATLASDITVTLPSSTGTIALTSDLISYAKLDTEDQALTGGARVTSKSLGTVASGTLTLDPGDRPLQHYTNNGAHTLAPGSNAGSIILDITNASSAGVITTSGWTKVVGAFTTTNGHKFRCHASIGNAGSLLTIQALQ
jgi:hypothetical protein